MTHKYFTFAALAIAAVAPAVAQERFDSAEAAAQALIESAAKHDTTRLDAIFGPQGSAILTTGNAQQDRSEQSEFSKLARAKHQLDPDPINANRVTLTIGDEGWPFPVPIIRTNGTWAFNPSDTKSEMQARRIGTNELDAIEICTGFVEAERKYATQNQGKSGVTFYAANFSSFDSGPGNTPLLPKAFIEAGWNGQNRSAKPYHGYYFRILDGQGDHAIGGAHSYRMKDKLMGGFGLVAWPAQYGVTGIQTYIVNQNGIVYEKDIAPPPAGTPVPITRYDPDPSWKQVE